MKREGLQKYPCRFFKTASRGQIDYSWRKCWYSNRQFFPCDKELHEVNFSEGVLLAGLGVRKYHGCKGKFNKKKCLPPKEFPFCRKALQTRQELHQHYNNVYFHLYMSHVKKHSREMTGEDVTIAIDTFTLLTPNHLCFPHQKWFLETIVATLNYWEGPLCAATVVCTRFNQDF